MSRDIKKVERISERTVCRFSGKEWKQKEVRITLHKKKVTHTDGVVSVFLESVSCPYLHDNPRSSSVDCRNYIPSAMNFRSSCRYNSGLRHKLSPYRSYRE